MNILVTGGAGFIGSHLVDALVKKGHKVTVLDNFSNGTLDNLFDSGSEIEIIHDDITDISVCEVFCENKDIVFHQAAVGSVPRSIEFPEITFKNNVTGFHNILQASVKNKVKRVIYASSSSVHGDEEGNILSPYALSKKVNEQYADVFSRVYGLETVGLRYFNVFGPRQRLDSVYGGVVPIFIDAVKNDTPAYINGDGIQSRDFTYIDNVVKANIYAMNTDGTGRAYDIGCGESYSVNHLFEIIRDLSGKDVNPIHRDARMGDIIDSRAYTKPAFVYMYYKARVGLKEGLKMTYEQWEPSSKCLTR